VRLKKIFFWDHKKSIKKKNIKVKKIKKILKNNENVSSTRNACDAIKDDLSNE
jgi:hypothetical protein